MTWNPTDERCGNCKYWPTAGPDIDGEPCGELGPLGDGSISRCVINPPMKTSSGHKGSASKSAEWPTTGKRDWCGEFSPRGTPLLTAAEKIEACDIMIDRWSRLKWSLVEPDLAARIVEDQMLTALTVKLIGLDGSRASEDVILEHGWRGTIALTATAPASRIEFCNARGKWLMRLDVGDGISSLPAGRIVTVPWPFGMRTA